jgi:hypothetical protein
VRSHQQKQYEHNRTCTSQPDKMFSILEFAHMYPVQIRLPSRARFRVLKGYCKSL